MTLHILDGDKPIAEQLRAFWTDGCATQRSNALSYYAAMQNGVSAEQLSETSGLALETVCAIYGALDDPEIRRNALTVAVLESGENPRDYADILVADDAVAAIINNAIPESDPNHLERVTRLNSAMTTFAALT
ncbi:MAG: hypothetical protein LBN02_03455 [Oscillospiraceae bacterium]|jgi:hypothetical protein|nr:hypothetical protein [Oscillospiraceae bacterium]